MYTIYQPGYSPGAVIVRSDKYKGNSLVSMTTLHNVPPTLGQVLRSALGYFLVVLVCTHAGYSVAHHQATPTSAEWKILAPFWLALLPAYVSRSALYEQKHLHVFAEFATNLQWLRWTYSLQLPGLLIFLYVASALAGVYSTDSADSTMCLFGRIAICIAPMYIMGMWLVAKWPSDNKLFTFRFRTFFPAFATCLMPFIYGYSGCADLFCCVIGSGIVLSFWVISLFLNSLRLAWLILALFLVIAFASIVFPLSSDGVFSRWIQVSTFGFLLTLAMGVSEAWRIAARVLNDEDYQPSGKYSDADKQLYLGGTNLATALFLPGFLLTAFHPATNIWYLILTLSLLVAQYLFWFIDRTPSKRTYWISIGVVSGLLLPIIISIGAHPEGSVFLSAKIRLITNGADSFTFAGFASVPFIYLVSQLKTVIIPLKVGPIRIAVAFHATAACLLLTGVVSGLFAVLIPLLSFPFPLSSGMEMRVSLLAYVYLIVSLLCLVIVLSIKIYSSNNNESMKSIESTPPSAPSSAKQVRFDDIVALVRPYPSLIAGVLSAGISLYASPWFKALQCGVAITALTMLGFVLNDIFDIEKDVRARARKVLAEGKLNVHYAIYASLLLTIIVFSVAPWSIYLESILFLCVLAVYGYSPFAHRYPTCKGIYTACLACTPLVYSSAVSGVRISLTVYSVLFAFILGREIFIDVHQRREDERAGFRTIAVALGGRTAATCATVTMAIGMCGLLTVSGSTWFSLLLASASAISFTIIMVRHKYPDSRPGLLRLPMLLGVLAIIATVIVRHV